MFIRIFLHIRCFLFIWGQNFDEELLCLTCYCHWIGHQLKNLPEKLQKLDDCLAKFQVTAGLMLLLDIDFVVVNLMSEVAREVEVVIETSLQFKIRMTCTVERCQLALRKMFEIRSFDLKKL